MFGGDVDKRVGKQDQTEILKLHAVETPPQPSSLINDTGEHAMHLLAIVHDLEFDAVSLG